MSGARAARRELAAAAVAFCLYTLVLCLPVLGGNTHFGIDGRYHQYPMRGFLAGQLARGELPLWWPAVRCGYPIHAYGEGGLLYPINAPLWRAFGVVQGTDVGQWLHLFLAGVAAFFLARQLGLRRAGGAVVGLCAAAGGGALATFDWPNAGAAQACSLLALAATAASARREGARAGAGRRFACLAALGWGAALLAGRPQRVYLLAPLAPALAAALAWPRGWSAAARAAGWGAGALLLGALVGAAQVVPTAELVARSDRAGGLSLEAASLGAFVPSARALRALFLGAVDRALLAGPGAEAARFPGRATWLLALGAGVLLLRRRRLEPWMAVLGALALGAALVAAGEALPFFGWGRALLPGFARFRAPGRALEVTLLAVALFAGWGLDRVGARRAWGGPVRAALVGLLALELLAYGQARLVPRPEAVFRAGNPALLRALACKGRVLVLGARPLVGEEVPEDEAEALRYVQAHEGFDTNFGAAHGLRYVGGYGALGLARFERFLRAGGEGRVFERLRLAGVERVASRRPLRAPGLEPFARVGDVAVLRFADPTPPAEFHATALLVPPGDPGAAERALAARGGPRPPVIEAPSPAEPEASPAREGNSARVAWARASPRRFEGRVEAPCPGWLVVRESWFPGWEATVNGRPVPVRAADLAFLAVRVPAGSSAVVLRYAPRSWWGGLLASALGLLLAAGGVALPWGRGGASATAADPAPAGRLPSRPRLPWLRALSVLAAGAFLAAAGLHLVEALRAAPDDPSPPWRHALFVVVNLGVASGLLWRWRGFLILFALLSAQQLWSHGAQALAAGTFSARDLGVLLALPAVWALLLAGRRARPGCAVGAQE